MFVTKCSCFLIGTLTHNQQIIISQIGKSYSVNLTCDTEIQNIGKTNLVTLQCFHLWETLLHAMHRKMHRHVELVECAIGLRATNIFWMPVIKKRKTWVENESPMCGEWSTSSQPGVKWGWPNLSFVGKVTKHVRTQWFGGENWPIMSFPEVGS